MTVCVNGGCANVDKTHFDRTNPTSRVQVVLAALIQTFRWFFTDLLFPRRWVIIISSQPKKFVNILYRE